MQGLKRCKCCAYKGSKILQFPGVLCVHARAQSAVIPSGSTYFNSQDFLHARVQNASMSPSFYARKGSKCSYFVRGSIYCYFLGFCACRISTRFTFQGCVHERDVARSASQGFHMLQFPGTLAHKDSKCCEPEIMCKEGVEHHCSTCRLHRLGSQNGHSEQF